MTSRLRVASFATAALAAGFAAGCASKPADPPPVVVAFSDVHFDPFHDPLLFPELVAAPASEWPAIFARAGSTDPGHFGTTTNHVLLQRSLAALQARRPAFVVFGGDLLVQEFRTFYFALAPGQDEASFRSFALKSVTYVVEQTRAALGATPVYFTLGNWDDYVGSFGLQPDDPFLADTVELFRVGLLANTAAPADFDATYRAGGYYAADVPGRRLVVVGLNTVFLAPQTLQATPDIDPAITRELDWLESTLSSVQASGRLAWIVMHVPPGGDLATTGGQVNPDGQVDAVTMLLRAGPQARLLAILAAHRDAVAGAFTGHTHMDEYRLASVALQGIPGITSDMGNAPAFKSFTVDGGWALQDYASWWLDLGDRTAAFQPYYDFSSAYGLLPPLAPSLAALVPQLATPGSAQTGYRVRYGSGHTPTKAITDLNWPVYLCGITFMGSQEIQGCVNGAD
jgi:sphingomyelin phosphodiesterase acid-like 3